MNGLAESVDEFAVLSGFSGVIRIDRDEACVFVGAYGLAHRGHRITNRVDTRFGLASGTKGLTALTVMTLVESGELDLAMNARSVLGDDLPLIEDEVSVEHLLSHRSGIPTTSTRRPRRRRPTTCCRCPSTNWRAPRT